MLAHDFILSNEVPGEVEDYSTLEKRIISMSKKKMTISDEFILKYHIVFGNVDMYTQRLGNIQRGLDYYGITIIDSSMALELVDKLKKYCTPCEDLKKMLEILNDCILYDCYIIHFGI